MSKNVMRAFNTPKKDDGVRNVFDLSQRHIFSAKAGQIIPVACVDTVPGDKFELDLVNIARTMPLNTAAFTRMKQSFDWVFVPYRALWSRFNEFIAQRNDPRSALYGSFCPACLHHPRPSDRNGNWIHQHHGRCTALVVWSFMVSRQGTYHL